MLEINDNFSTANYVRENSRVETVLKTRRQRLFWKIFWKAFFAIYFMTDLLCQDVGLEIS